MHPGRVVEIHVIRHPLVYLGIGTKLVSQQALALEYPVKRLNMSILVRGPWGYPPVLYTVTAARFLSILSAISLRTVIRAYHRFVFAM